MDLEETVEKILNFFDGSTNLSVCDRALLKVNTIKDINHLELKKNFSWSGCFLRKRKY